MVKALSHCPDSVEDLAEAYCMDSLPPGAARAFEEHCAVCPACATALGDADDFVRAMQEAARVLRAASRNGEKTRKAPA